MSRHTYLCPMRWGDMDAQRHVNNAVVIDYLQEARIDYLFSGANAHLLGDGVLVVAHQVEYTAPIPFSSEPVRIELWPDAVGAARFSISYELFAGDTMVARARTVITPYDLATATIRRLAPGERATLFDDVEAPVELRPLPKELVTRRAFVWPCRVRWADLDSYGHVNNVKYYDYLQEARVAALTPVWSVEEVWLLIRQDMEYRKPMDFTTTPYAVHMGVVRFGTTSLTIASEIRDHEGTVYATARSILVLGGSDGRPVPIPAATREHLAQWEM